MAHHILILLHASKHWAFPALGPVWGLRHSLIIKNYCLYSRCAAGNRTGTSGRASVIQQVRLCGSYRACSLSPLATVTVRLFKFFMCLYDHGRPCWFRRSLTFCYGRDRRRDRRTQSCSVCIDGVVYYACMNAVLTASTRCRTSRMWWYSHTVKYCGFRQRSTRVRAPSTSSTFRSTSRSVAWSSARGRSMAIRSVIRAQSHRLHSNSNVLLRSDSLSSAITSHCSTSSKLKCSQS